MSPDDPAERFSLSRWSRRKHEAARVKAPESVSSPVTLPVAPVTVAAVPAPPEPLPPVESLTIDSDFSKFLAPKVEESVKRAALRKLFSDPHFNVMDGLDVYIDDYTKSDPMPEDMLAKLKDVYETLTEKGEEAVASQTVTETDPPSKVADATDAAVSNDSDVSEKPST